MRLILALLLLAVLTACSSPETARDGGAPAETAAKFGEVTLPQGVEVLGADTAPLYGQDQISTNDHGTDGHP